MARSSTVAGKEIFLAKALSNLGILLSLEGRSREAELAVLESLSLFKNSGQVTIVPNDAEILICLSTLDRIYADEKRPVEAAAIRRSALR